MKLGEIKLEALKIMNINNDSVLLVEHMDSILGEKRYAKYLNNMFNCINKAIDIINHKKVLPQKRIELLEVPITKNKINNRYNISGIEDFLSVARIVYEDDKTYCERVPYGREGEHIVISSKFSPEYLALIYDSKIPNITGEITDKDEVPFLKDELARLIPYYIKFELYQEDEPDLALTSRNTFDQGIESLREIDDSQEEFIIEKVYSNEGCQWI